MGTSTEGLKDDIERTRADLGETLDAIGDRVSPGRMMERRKNRLMSGMDAVWDRLMGTAHDAAAGVREVPDKLGERTEGAPMLAGALAFGVGFLAAVAMPATEPERRLGAPLVERAQPLKDDLQSSAREAAQHLAEPAKQSAEAIKEAAASGAQEVAEHAKEARDEAVDEAQAAAQRARQG